MLNFKNENSIEESNEEILKCVDLAKLMERPEWKFLEEFISEKEDVYRFTDVLGIEKDELEIIKGRVQGINEVKALFSEIKNRAEMPERDPKTGENKPMNNEQAEEE